MTQNYEMNILEIMINIIFLTPLLPLKKKVKNVSLQMKPHKIHHEEIESALVYQLTVKTSLQLLQIITIYKIIISNYNNNTVNSITY